MYIFISEAVPTVSKIGLVFVRYAGLKRNKLLEIPVADNKETVSRSAGRLTCLHVVVGKEEIRSISML